MTESPSLPEREPSPLDELGRVHLIGVAGAGMSALTRMMCARGVPVTGSELRESRVVASLRALGGSDPPRAVGRLAPAADTVIVSTAITDSNPEVVAARERGIRVLHRAEALAYCMRGLSVRGGRRYPRQDHDHLDGRCSPSTLRYRSVVLHRCAAQ